MLGYKQIGSCGKLVFNLIEYNYVYRIMHMEYVRFITLIGNQPYIDLETKYANNNATLSFQECVLR